MSRTDSQRGWRTQIGGLREQLEAYGRHADAKGVRTVPPEVRLTGTTLRATGARSARRGLAPFEDRDSGAGAPPSNGHRSRHSGSGVILAAPEIRLGSTALELTGPTPTRPRLGIGAALASRRGLICVAVVLIAAAVAHGYNMLHYPYLSDDEGTYFAQGWAVFHLGRLAPYTYIYDHAPLGWIQIAVWQLITAGASFGYGLASGRVLMLLFQVGSALLVIGIGRRATGKLWVGLLAAVLMSLLPFGIFYQRRILLDNIATFWLLMSLYALSGPAKLRNAWWSAAALAVAILSKETAIAALPALLVLVARRFPSQNRRFAVVGWTVIVLSICSVYVLLALVKGELFPAGTALGGSHPHVSLLCTVLWQSTRTNLSGSGSFASALSGWMQSEPLLVFGGSACALYLIVACRRRAVASTIGLTALLLAVLIARNGVVFAYYLLPLLPLLALSVAVALDSLATSARRRAGLGRRPSSRVPRSAFAIVVVAGLAAIAIGAAADWRTALDGKPATALFTGDQVAGQLAAERWIERHVPRDSRMVIDMSMWQDLHVPNSGPPFRYAEDDWKAAEDPAIRDGVFHDNWRNVSYVITTPGVIADTETNRFPVVAAALEHSRLVRSFDTGGWPIEVRRVQPDTKVLLPLPLAPVAAPTSGGPDCMTGQP